MVDNAADRNTVVDGKEDNKDVVDSKLWVEQ